VDAIQAKISIGISAGPAIIVIKSIATPATMTIRISATPVYGFMGC
jgi:hypothetical protein